MSIDKKKRSFLTAEEALANDAKSWQLPIVEGNNNKPDDYTNAYKKPEGWVYEPPEADEEPPKLPTLEEIEAIQQAAYDEGFEQGKKAGFDIGLEEGREQGVLNGLEDGLDKGIEDGLEQGKGLIDEKADTFNQLAENMQQPLRNIEHQVEQQILELATQLAKAVIKTELTTNPQILLQTIQEAIKSLPVAKGEYQIQLHPDDLTIVQQNYDQETLDKKHWDLQGEPTLTRGSCHINIDTSSVTYTIEQRCSEILDRFLLENTSDN